MVAVSVVDVLRTVVGIVDVLPVDVASTRTVLEDPVPCPPLPVVSNKY